VGETDKDGKYELESYGGKEGAPAGHYKVAVSYLVSPQGDPQGLSARSSLAPSPETTTATERLPKEYSDLGRTKLSADVGLEGGTFNFDIDAPQDPASAGKSAPKADAAPAPEKDHPAAKTGTAEKATAGPK
jgi:hypothetical protein